MELSKALTEHQSIPLVSFTGSEKVGRIVAGVVASRYVRLIVYPSSKLRSRLITIRLGKLILELGGNNAVIVLPDADLDLALRTVVFGAVGTAGQRCTTTRRLLLHSSIADDFVGKIVNAYKQVRIGDPLAKGTLMGPVHSSTAIEAYKACLKDSASQGGKVLCGGDEVKHGDKALDTGNWVAPAIVYHGAKHPGVMEEETFAPVLREPPVRLLSWNSYG